MLDIVEPSPLFQKHLNRPEGMRMAVEGHGDRPGIALRQLRLLFCQIKPAGGIIRDNGVFPARVQNRFEFRMLIGITASTEGDQRAG